MKNLQSFLGRIVHSSPVGPAAIILLLFLNQTIFAGLPPVRPESAKTKNSCEKKPTQCSSLCQTDLLAEVRATELEKHSRKTRIEADKAAQKAVSVEKQVNKELRKTSSLKNTSSSGTVNPRAKFFWKTVGIIPRLFVSKEARVRADAEEKEAEKYGTNPLPNYAGQYHLQLMLKSQMTSKTAEEAKKVAADAKIEADQARAYADKARQSYKSCLSGKESQFESR
jgi:hypothetical protein